MGCASSTPMVQTAGSDMLKAATHVADDATQAAEDAVQDVKDSVGKTLETAKETMATKVEEVKHELDSTLKEKTQNLDDAKNALMEKLHLSSAATESTQMAAAESALGALKEDVSTAAEAETKDLTEILKQSTETMPPSSSSGSGTATNETDTVRLARTDTETDSLRTSTPEPEIERALANTKANSGDDDNPPTPIPTYSELENLGNELLQQQHQMVNDIDKPTINDPLMTAVQIAPADNMTTTSMTTTTTTATIPDTINTNAMHITPIMITTATSLASAIAATTTSALQDTNVFMCLTGATQTTMTTQENPPPTKTKAAKRDEKQAAERSKQQKLIKKLLEEKRPTTTEWEKYADTLALFRKFNPHDAFRRGGTLTKFNGAKAIREMPQFGGRGDDDSSDTTSNWGRKSPGLRSSARPGGRMHRPNSANQRNAYGGNTTRRNSNAMSSGRKFDYNPARSRVNDRGSSSVSSGQNLANLPSTANAYGLSPSFGTQSPTHAHESVKSPPEMRSQHSPLGTYTTQRLEPLWSEQPDHDEPLLKQRHFQNGQSSNKYAKTPPTQPPGGSSMPLDAMPLNIHHLSPLTRESSNASLSSQNMYRGHIRSYKSSTDLRTSAQLTPHHHHHNHRHQHEHEHHHLNHQHQNPPVRNTSSFLTTPRTSPFSLTKSYTDLYFSSSSNKENEKSFQTDLSSVAQQRHIRDKSPYKIRQRCEVCCKKYITSG